jgi:tRNA 2-selenouridine synthase
MPVVDVRSPAEYAQGHIPGALNMPLFTDEERKIVGTTYKQQGRKEAIVKGLDFAGRKLSGFVLQANTHAPDQNIILYCWRGGMRSESMAWLLSLAGFDVYLLENGYKAFRRYCFAIWEKADNLIVLSGKTGCGKTDILLSLKKSGCQVIDLEGLAGHRGSAFGAIGKPPQPTNEQFENLLALEWQQMDWQKPVWVEDESRRIGSVFLPEKLFQMKYKSMVIELDISKSIRIQRLIADYASYPKELLLKSTEKIERKLGGQHAKTASEAIQLDDFETAVDIILTYYDKAYEYDILQHHPNNIFKLEINTGNARENAQHILDFMKSFDISTFRPSDCSTV